MHLHYGISAINLGNVEIFLEFIQSSFPLVESAQDGRRSAAVLLVSGARKGFAARSELGRGAVSIPAGQVL